MLLQQLPPSCAVQRQPCQAAELPVPLGVPGRAPGVASHGNTVIIPGTVTMIGHHLGTSHPPLISNAHPSTEGLRTAAMLIPRHPPLGKSSLPAPFAGCSHAGSVPTGIWGTLVLPGCQPSPRVLGWGLGLGEDAERSRDAAGWGQAPAQGALIIKQASGGAGSGSERRSRERSGPRQPFCGT